jgi:hypothetical protein
MFATGKIEFGGSGTQGRGLREKKPDPVNRTIERSSSHKDAKDLEKMALLAQHTNFPMLLTPP